jgi:hypothetical protein
MNKNHKTFKNKYVLKKKKNITKKNTLKKKIIKKKSKKYVKQAKFKLFQYGSSGTEEEQLLEERQKALKKVGNFVLKNKSKIRANFLKTICSDSGVCIAFGTEIKNINEFFNNFMDFEYAVSPIKRLGVVSQNGFVKEIKFSREGYDAYTILKSATNKSSDNLMYEYEVGQFINKKNKLFPCFIETYGLFVYKDEEDWNNAKNEETITADVLKNSLYEFNEIDYSVGCPESRDIAILIQEIKDATTMVTYLKNLFKESNKNKKNILINYELLDILYQIYMPLATLSNVFTHYDLHLNNILLYEPIKNGYITYNYHLISGKIIKFNSKYIVKIIDYGRSYYKDETHSSKETYEAICKINDCNPDCGKDYGLNQLAPEIIPGFFHYISSQNRNMSADLRLINSLVKHLIYIPVISKKFFDLLNRIIFSNNYGTKEIVDSGLPTTINNVVDLCKALEEIIDTPDFTLYNDSYFKSLNCIGKFYIYENGDTMKYEK